MLKIIHKHNRSWYIDTNIIQLPSDRSRRWDYSVFCKSHFVKIWKIFFFHTSEYNIHTYSTHELSIQTQLWLALRTTNKYCRNCICQSMAFELITAIWTLSIYKQKKTTEYFKLKFRNRNWRISIQWYLSINYWQC